MTFSTLKIPLPYVWFCVGLFPWVIYGSIVQFYEPVIHSDPLIPFVLLLCLIVPTVCFVIEFAQSFKLKGKHRRICLTLNGLGLAALLFLAFGGLKLLMN